MYPEYSAIIVLYTIPCTPVNIQVRQAIAGAASVKHYTAPVTSVSVSALVAWLDFPVIFGGTFWLHLYRTFIVMHVVQLN